MPLGDSITRGSSGTPPYTGYRKHLFNYLIRDGIDFDFVGSMNDGNPDEFDTDHEGHGGWKVQDIDANINLWLTDSYPDIVLLHIGTNDIGSRESNESTIIEIEGIIDKIYNYNSEM